MVGRVDFYHLTRSSLEDALPALLVEASKDGRRVLVMAGSAERVAQLDAYLWTYQADSWLPHGAARDDNAGLQPIFLTDGDDNPNGATLLVLTDGVMPSHPEEFDRCLTLFDDQDGPARAASRQLWTEMKAQGAELVYHQQDGAGEWHVKTRVEGHPREATPTIRGGDASC